MPRVIPKDHKGIFVSYDCIHLISVAANKINALMTIDDLVEAVIQNYDKLDIETQQLLPLKRVYWPA